MITIKFDTKEVTDWINADADRERAKRKLLAITGDKLKQEVRNEARKISTTSQLLNSIQFRTRKNSVEVYSVGYGEIALETGRGAGPVPIEPLKRWARLKLGDERLAYAVAKTIAKKGTRKYRRGGPKQLTTVVEKIDKFLKKDLINYLDSFAQ